MVLRTVAMSMTIDTKNSPNTVAPSGIGVRRGAVSISQSRSAKKRSIRWLIRFARDRSERTMAERLANEFIAASKGEGGAVRMKEDVHRMAEANKAFAHYRF